MKTFIKDDFKDLLEYRSWVNQQMNGLSWRNEHFKRIFEQPYVENTLQVHPKWFGNTTFTELSKGITTFKDPLLIERIYEQVNHQVSTYTRERIKAKKIKYNPVGLGVFVFDRAAMGMYRQKEYYSSIHHGTVQDNEVRQNGDSYLLIKDGSPVEKRWEERPDGSPKIRTTSKNVFAYYPKVRKENKAVELYLSCGGAVGVPADKFLYSGISALIVAQLLEKARIKTRISIVIGSSPDKFQYSALLAIIPIKNFDEHIDTNLLALLSSDPRFFRYEGFKGLISLYDYYEQNCPENLGTGLNLAYLKQTLKDYHPEITNRFYFGWTFSETEALKNIEETINEIAKKIEP